MPTRRRWALNYYIILCTGNSISLEIRQVGEKMLDWGTCPREVGPPGPGWAAQENRKETQLWPIEWGSICCSSVRSPTPSHTQPFQQKWEVYFSKDLCCLSSLCRRYITACICICVYNNMTQDKKNRMVHVHTEHRLTNYTTDVMWEQTEPL